MAYREFTDSTGVEWRVWETLPSTPATVSEPMRHGWLAFAAEGVRKRLTPIPHGWEACTTAELEHLCVAAALAPPSRLEAFGGYRPGTLPPAAGRGGTA